MRSTWYANHLQLTLQTETIELVFANLKIIYSKARLKCLFKGKSVTKKLVSDSFNQLDQDNF